MIQRFLIRPIMASCRERLMRKEGEPLDAVALIQNFVQSLTVLNVRPVGVVNLNVSSI